MNATISNEDLLKERIDFLESENRSLKAEIEELKEILAIEMERSYIRTELKTNRLLKQNKLERRKNRRTDRKLEDAEQKLKQAYSLAKKELATKAGKAKQSPYEKAGTIAAVNEILEKNQEILKKKGGKTILYKLIRDLIASGAIAAPREPTEKTILQWITNFENRKSAS
ncbi:hypothetical protein [Neisseria sicca]|uniref:hypothetical protein n=1 Tax=Neisseria sicca TaxID=490 RepID=UPI000A588ED1|nr:hypothetical protein [Neisseria sicca]